tara:strand:+ start:538 stop:651 length:114 start_codon:yes stop_codon:yes gene_type:complete
MEDADAAADAAANANGSGRGGVLGMKVTMLECLRSCV